MGEDSIAQYKAQIQAQIQAQAEYSWKIRQACGFGLTALAVGVGSFFGLRGSGALPVISDLLTNTTTIGAASGALPVISGLLTNTTTIGAASGALTVISDLLTNTTTIGAASGALTAISDTAELGTQLVVWAANRN
jgi:hypothetical protein